MDNNLSVRNYIDASVASATKYYYIVNAYNSSGASLASNETTITTSSVSVTPPSAPTKLIATVSGNNKVDLSWLASTGTGTITYSILRSTTSGSGYTTVTDNISALKYTDGTVVKSTRYYCGTDGRFWVAVDGQKIVDHSGPNMGDYNLPVTRIFVNDVYSGGTGPVTGNLTDLQIWNGFPCGYITSCH